jgi:bleomycin hydrolase
VKYGMVPHSICPDTHSATSSSRLDALLSTKLREYTTLIRSSASAADARSLKSQYLAEVYNVCAVTLGVPPKPDEEFTWEYNDKDGKYHTWTGTPKQFYEQFGKRKHMDPQDAFSLVHDPRNEQGKVYMMDKFGLGNVLGRPSIKCEL